MCDHGTVAGPTNTQFAVAAHVLTYLSAAGGERPVSSDELSASTNTNPVYVRRVLGPLRDAGLVHARQGSQGGWTLDRPAADITLADVWSLLQGDEPVLGLHGPNPKCPIGAGIQDALHDLDGAVAAALRAELGRRTIADLVRQATGSGSVRRRRR
jgi:Rrf2 family protein